MASERALSKPTRRKPSKWSEERTAGKKLVSSGDVEHLMKLKGNEDAISVKRKPKSKSPIFQLTPTMLTKNSCSSADKPVIEYGKYHRTTPGDLQTGHVSRSSHPKRDDGSHVTGSHHIKEGGASHVTGREEDIISAWKRCCAQKTEKLIASWLKNRVPSKYTDILTAL